MDFWAGVIRPRSYVRTSPKLPGDVRQPLLTRVREPEVSTGGWLRPPELCVTAAIHGQVNEPDEIDWSRIGGGQT